MPALSLPSKLQAALAPVFEAVPLDESMPDLVPGMTASQHRALGEKVLSDPALKNRPDLAAGIWLYLDDIERAHEVSQDMTDQTGSIWHAIVHRREGDFWNSGYWLRRAGAHPAFTAGYDPDVFLRDVQRKHEGNPSELVQTQRTEWLKLFNWCAKAGKK